MITVGASNSANQKWDNSNYGQNTVDFFGKEELEARSVSGSIGMVLPESKGFAVQFNTVSGEFFSDFALKKDGNRYIFGDGNADIKIDTTSGGVNIRTK